jgi:hypothetical protein
MKNRPFASLLLLGALPIGCSQREPAPAPVPEASREVATEATVLSVDLAQRGLAVVGPYGNRIECRADERVRNLDQIKPGDPVALTYIESTAVQVVKKAAPEDGEDVVVFQAADGEQTAGGASRPCSVTAEVVGFDPLRGALTLRGGDGDCRTILVRHPDRMAALKIGDLLWISYREALAVSVEPATRDVR